MFSNIFKVFKNPNTLIVWMIVTIISCGLVYAFFDIEPVIGNYGAMLAYYDLVLSGIVLLCFPLLVSGLVYRGLLFGKKRDSTKGGFFGIVSGIISVFITGSVCCGVSLISVLGLTSIVSFFDILPFHGIEIKTVAVGVLLYATYDLYRYLEVCKIQRS